MDVVLSTSTTRIDKRYVKVLTKLEGLNICLGCTKMAPFLSPTTEKKPPFLVHPKQIM
jgi:hypothetical protein